MKERGPDDRGTFAAVLAPTPPWGHCKVGVSGEILDEVDDFATWAPDPPVAKARLALAWLRKAELVENGR